MDDVFIGEIRIVPWAWAPEGWFLCNGQSLLISQYQALFAVIGNKFGGDGRINFNLPNLSGKAAACQGQGPGLSSREIAQTYGAEAITLMPNQIPPHDHLVYAGRSTAGAAGYTSPPSANTYLGRSPVAGDKSYSTQVSPLTPLSATAVSSAGGNGAHENRQPFLVMNYIICFDGEYPVRP